MALYQLSYQSVSQSVTLGISPTSVFPRANFSLAELGRSLPRGRPRATKRPSASAAYIVTGRQEHKMDDGWTDGWMRPFLSASWNRSVSPPAAAGHGRWRCTHRWVVSMHVSWKCRCVAHMLSNHKAWLCVKGEGGREREDVHLPRQLRDRFPRPRTWKTKIWHDSFMTFRIFAKKGGFESKQRSLLSYVDVSLVRQDPTLRRLHQTITSWNLIFRRLSHLDPFPMIEAA